MDTTECIEYCQNKTFEDVLKRKGFSDARITQLVDRWGVQRKEPANSHDALTALFAILGVEK